MEAAVDSWIFMAVVLINCNPVDRICARPTQLSAIRKIGEDQKLSEMHGMILLSSRPVELPCIPSLESRWAHIPKKFRPTINYSKVADKLCTFETTASEILPIPFCNQKSLMIFTPLRLLFNPIFIDHCGSVTRP